MKNSIKIMANVYLQCYLSVFYGNTLFLLSLNKNVVSQNSEQSNF